MSQTTNVQMDLLTYLLACLLTTCPTVFSSQRNYDATEYVNGTIWTMEKRRVTYRVMTARKRTRQQNGTVFLGDVLDRPASARVRVRIRVGTLHISTTR